MFSAKLPTSRAMLWMALVAMTLMCAAADENYILILDHKNTADGFFSTSLFSSGLENENDPSANTYSIIGDLDEDELRDDSGRFNFKLVFKNSDGTVQDELVWSQESWLTDSTIVGADLSAIPDDSATAYQASFFGLARSSYSASYLDGSDSAVQWFHAVGSVVSVQGYDGGIPAHNGKVAYGQSLYVLGQRECDEFNIDAFLNECSADFPAEQEALEAVEVRVSQLEVETATSEDLATTDAAVEALSADLLTLESEMVTSANLAATDEAVQALSADLSTLESETATSANLAATDEAVEALSADLLTLESETATSANLAATDSAVDGLSSRLADIEETLSNYASAHVAPAQTAQYATQSTSTDLSVSSWILSGKDLLIMMSLAVNTVLLTALLVVLCRTRTGKGYKAVGTFAQSDSEMAELQ